MKQFKKKSPVYEGIKYIGELGPLKKLLGIKDADYDTQTRDFILPDSQDVVVIGNWVLKNGSEILIIPGDEYLADNFEEIEEDLV